MNDNKQPGGGRADDDVPPRGADIVQRDDGMFALGWHDGAAGPFASRAHAEAIAARDAAAGVVR